VHPWDRESKFAYISYFFPRRLVLLCLGIYLSLFASSLLHFVCHANWCRLMHSKKIIKSVQWRKEKREFIFALLFTQKKRKIAQTFSYSIKPVKFKFMYKIFMYVQLKRVVETRLLLHEKTIALNSERDMFSLKYHYESLNLFSFSRAFFGSNIWVKKCVK
jgi:uncharacterized protein (DUF2132 family)